MMVDKQETHLRAMAVRIALFRGVDSAYRRLRHTLKLREIALIQNRDKPTVGVYLFGRKQFPVPASKRIRNFLQESFIVNGLAMEDFVEVVVQQFTIITLNTVYKRRFEDKCNAIKRSLYRGLFIQTDTRNLWKAGKGKPMMELSWQVFSSAAGDHDDALYDALIGQNR